MKLTEYVESMRQKVQQIGAKKIANESGLVYTSVRLFALGGNPTYKMLQGIEAALEQMERAK